MAAEIIQAPSLTTEQKIDAIYEFCARFAQLMDVIGNNPMLQAMLPPGIFD